MGGPPAQLDGADVLCWVASRRGGYYQLVGSDPPIPLYEVYGCTEAGQVATRRTVIDPTWQVYMRTDSESIGVNN